MTLALHGKSRTRRTWLLAAALLAVVVGIGGSLMLNRQVSEASPPSVIYNAIPSPLAPNYPSQPFQAQQTAEFGDHVSFAGSDRVADKVTVTMSTWAVQADYPALTDPTGWDHPITLNLYQVATPGPTPTVGAPIASITRTVHIPWRPAADPTCATPTAWRAPDTLCYNGYAVNIEFDLNSLHLTLPNELIYGIAYNTQTWGYAPIGAPGPYNSLNIALASVAPSVGTDPDLDDVFWNTSTAAWYADGGAGGVGTFRRDTGWGSPTLYVPAVKFSATTAPVSVPVIVRPSSLNGWAAVHDNDATGITTWVPGPAGGLGNGSARMQLPNSTSGEFLGTQAYAGVRLDSLATLSYSTYRTSLDAGNNLAIALQMNVDYDPADAFVGWQGRLVYEPYQSPGVSGTITSGVWQNWNALAPAARWWSSGAPGNALCPQAAPCTWQQVLTNWPNIRIQPGPLSGIGFKGGSSWAGFDGNVDNFTIGDNFNQTTFDMEPDIPCTTVCYVRTTGADTNDGSSPATAKLTIQAGINAVNVGGTVNVGPGTYLEDVDLNKNGVQLLGAGIDQTIIMGPKGNGDSITLDVVSGANVLIDGFTITREGNNAADWEDANGALNNNGVSFGTGGGGGTLQNSKITGNRNGILVQSTVGLVIQNNIIDDNRTGVHVNNNNTNLNIHNNFITNNWTMGVLFRDDTLPGSNTSTGLLLNNNNISGNWASQIEARATFANIINAENNWLGTLTPTTLAATSSGEQNYTDQDPPRTPPSSTPTAASIVYYTSNAVNPVDFTPFLCSGTDVAPSTIGFQPLFDCGDIEVTSTSAFVGDTNVQVQVRANSVENLYGTQTFLTYDQTKLSLNGVTLGGGLASQYVAVNTSSAGLIQFSYTQTLPTPPVTGTGVVLATLTFSAIAPGSATIGYQPAQTQLFSNHLGQPMGPLAKVDGIVTITNAPAPTGTVTGNIFLQGRSNHSGIIVQIDPPGGLISGPSNSSGAVSVAGVASGPHTVQASMLGYLKAVKLLFPVSAGTNATNTVTLLGGDANMDATINILDLSLVAAYFGQSPAYAPPLAPNTTPDINGDNVVNILDLSLTAANFGAVGPTSW